MRSPRSPATVMATLGGIRDQAATDRYMAVNLEHWQHQDSRSYGQRSTRPGVGGARRTATRQHRRTRGDRGRLRATQPLLGPWGRGRDRRAAGSLPGCRMRTGVYIEQTAAMGWAVTGVDVPRTSCEWHGVVGRSVRVGLRRCDGVALRERRLRRHIRHDDPHRCAGHLGRVRRDGTSSHRRRTIHLCRHASVFRAIHRAAAGRDAHRPPRLSGCAAT
jgi:hypothetical protein